MGHFPVKMLKMNYLSIYLSQAVKFASYAYELLQVTNTDQEAWVWGNKAQESHTCERLALAGLRIQTLACTAVTGCS